MYEYNLEVVSEPSQQLVVADGNLFFRQEDLMLLASTERYAAESWFVVMHLDTRRLTAIGQDLEYEYQGICAAAATALEAA